MLNRLPLPTQMPPLWMLIEDIGNPKPRELAKALAVTEASVKRWIKLDAAPRPVMLAIFWLTRWGQSSVHCEAHNDAVMQAGIASNLRRQVERLQTQLDHLGRIGDFGAANDPATGVRGPRPFVGAPQLHAATAEKPARRTGKTVAPKTGKTKQPRRLQRG